MEPSRNNNPSKPSSAVVQGVSKTQAINRSRPTERVRPSVALMKQKARLRGIRLFNNYAEKRRAARTQRKAKGLKNRSTTQLAGLQFNCDYVRRKLIRDLNIPNKHKVTRTAGVYCAAVLEYMIAEVVEMAGNCAKELNNRPARIKPRDILLAIRGDDEFDNLLKGVIIPAAGVFPYIPRELLDLEAKKSPTTIVSSDPSPVKDKLDKDL